MTITLNRIRRGRLVRFGVVIGIVITVGCERKEPVHDTAAARQDASFEDLDHGITDCRIPFKDLKRLSPVCQVAGTDPARRCERYSSKQFPEVVAVENWQLTMYTHPRLCSGTVIAPNWVLTAAHCFLGDSVSADMVMPRGVDPAFANLSPGAVKVRADNASVLTERFRDVTKVIIHRDYGARMSTPPFMADLALLQLATPYPARALKPVRLAITFSAESTIAGYGYSDAGGGEIDRFNLTWPPYLKPDVQQMSFVPVDDGGIVSGFCFGDSGGPVYAGRYRGCKATEGEPRPRELQGIISYEEIGGKQVGVSGRHPCVSSALMTMQDITIPERREWICSQTERRPVGCD